MRRVDKTPKGTSLAKSESIDVQYVGLERSGSAVGLPEKSPEENSSNRIARSSAAALSTVLRTTTLSYGNMRFSGTCPAETAQPIKMQFCTIHYVGEITQCAKIGCNGDGFTGK
jgi:hypothetical protein